MNDKKRLILSIINDKNGIILSVINDKVVSVKGTKTQTPQERFSCGDDCFIRDCESSTCLGYYGFG